MSDYIHKVHPTLCDPKDFWGQIKRTVNGKPVTEEQIEMIVQAIRQGLTLQPQDDVLDLGCGNGALAAHFFENVAGYVGVDFSEYLLKVANENFEKPPQRIFILNDIVGFLQTDAQPERYTKVLLYGCFSYLTEVQALQTLQLLAEKYPNVQRIFIGNLPDKAKSAEFLKERNVTMDLTDSQSAIGIWRTEEEFKNLCTMAGWATRFSRMPEGFYGSKYRYDVSLVRVGI